MGEVGGAAAELLLVPDCTSGERHQVETAAAAAAALESHCQSEQATMALATGDRPMPVFGEGLLPPLKRLL